MSRSKARLAADWFAKLRVNAATQAIEHDDIKAVETEVAAVSDSVSTTVTSQLTSVSSDVQAASDAVTSLSGVVTAKLDASAYTAADVLTKVKTVDGSGSGLDADTLDGQHASAFQPAGSYLTGNQTITLTGDVSGSGTTSINVTVADDSHNHIIANVDGLQAALDGKASTSHSHTIANVTGLQAALDGKQAAGSYLTGNQTITLTGDVSGSGTTSIAVTIADDSHNHIIANVDGLQAALDGKLSTSGKAADSNLLDGIDSSAFVRNNNGAQSIAGNLTLSNGSILYAQKAASATTGGTAGIETKNGGGTGDGSLAAVAFHCEGTYATNLHLRNDGYLGAGGWSASSWRWYVYMPNGDMTAAGNVTAYSDERLKDNVAPLENALDKVLSLDGVSFTWKNLPEVVGRAGQNDLGILAQQVEAVAPEAVSSSPHISDDGDPYKTVAYDKLVPLLIEAIKEQQTQIDALKAKLEV